MTGATKNQREGGVTVRSVVSRELADKLREMATEENRTLSAMIALLLARQLEKNNELCPWQLLPDSILQPDRLLLPVLAPARVRRSASRSPEG